MVDAGCPDVSRDIRRKVINLTEPLVGESRRNHQFDKGMKEFIGSVNLRCSQNVTCFRRVTVVKQQLGESHPELGKTLIWIFPNGGLQPFPRESRLFKRNAEIGNLKEGVRLQRASVSESIHLATDHFTLAHRPELGTECESKPQVVFIATNLLPDHRNGQARFVQSNKLQSREGAFIQ